MIAKGTDTFNERKHRSPGTDNLFTSSRLDFGTRFIRNASKVCVYVFCYIPFFIVETAKRNSLCESSV